MFIEIEKDILEDALKKEGYDRNFSRDLLIAMALCVAMGKHYVFVPALRQDSDLRDNLVKLLGKSYVAMLDHTNRRYTESTIIKHKVCVKAVITISSLTSHQSGVITINPMAMTKFEPWVETFILTENLIDAEFYNYTVLYYKRKERVQSCKLSYYPLMGGGNTVAKVMENEVALGQHFCLAIVDSDKKCPNRRIGETAQHLLDVLINRPFNCSAYVMDKVMEIENLIPNRLVIEYGDGAGYKEVFAKDPSFFDLKKGLTLESIKDDDVYDYWKDLITDEQGRFDERDKVLKSCNKDEEYFEKVKGCRAIKNGFGNKLLQNVVDGSRASNKSDLESLYAVQDMDLNSFQQDEWWNIGKIMFSWTCACKM